MFSKFLMIFHFILLFISMECDRKSKRTKEDRLMSIPKYHLYQSSNLPNDLQITTFLFKGETKLFSYYSSVSTGALSATLITCSSTIQWAMKFYPDNKTLNHNIIDDNMNNNILTNDMSTQHFEVKNGFYLLEIKAIQQNTYLNIYISTEKGGPQTLQTNQTKQNLRLLKRHRRKRLTVRWDPSLVDPQGTDYCLVVSNKKYYHSLCSAQAERYGIPIPNHRIPYDEDIKASIQSQNVITVETQPLLQPQDPLIICVGKKTQYTIMELEQGQSYYFNLFAINHQSNLTYPYGSAFMIFDKHIKPLALRDGKPTLINLKKYDGKVVLRFKVGKRSGNSLNFFVIPCGGAVDVEITLKGEIVTTQRRIEGFGEIILSNPLIAGRYYIKIIASNREELRKISGVEVYVTTTKLSANIPIPQMPTELMVKEYTGLRKCDSVTVGWLPAPIPKMAHYCWVVKEGKIRETDDYRMPNQCGLENRLKKSADFIFKYCSDIKHDRAAIVKKITKLKPGRSYIVQVTVKKPKGKTLSYDLLQVHTERSCKLYTQ